jgi:hypothetical protein
MLQKENLDRLIVELQAFAASYDEHAAFAAKYIKDKAEHGTVSKELVQFRRELEHLKLEYQDKRQELGKLMADIVRRHTELERINAEIGQAKQRAFGG